MTNEFLKKQQELADALHRNRTDRPSRKEIHQLVKTIITNTGEELMRLAEGERYDRGHGPKDIDMDPASMFQQGNNAAIDTIKQHITSVTGVE